MQKKAKLKKQYLCEFFCVAYVKIFYQTRRENTKIFFFKVITKYSNITFCPIKRADKATANKQNFHIRNQQMFFDIFP